MKRLTNLIFLTTFVTYLGCSLSVDPNTYKAKNYKIENLNSEWSETKPDLSDFAFEHSSGAFLVFNSVCKKYSVPKLKALKNSLLYGISDLKIIEEKKLTIFNREGLKIHSKGKIDGVGVHIHSKIFNRNHCTHDVVLITPQRRSFASLTKELDRLEEIMIFND